MRIRVVANAIAASVIQGSATGCACSSCIWSQTKHPSHPESSATCASSGEKAWIAVLAGGWKIDRETHWISESARADYREHRGTGSSQIPLDLTIYSSQWNCREKFSIP